MGNSSYKSEEKKRKVLILRVFYKNEDYSTNNEKTKQLIHLKQVRKHLDQNSLIS